MELRQVKSIFSTVIKLPFVIKIFVLSIFEWPFYIGCSVFCCALLCVHSGFKIILNIYVQKILEAYIMSA